MAVAAEASVEFEKAPERSLKAAGNFGVRH